MGLDLDFKDLNSILDLDFTALNSIPCKSDQNENSGEKKYYSLEREKEEREKARKAYSEYQNNIKKAGMLRNSILKGIRAGEDPVKLLLMAMEVIGLMTGNKTLYSQSTEDIKAIYGWGLGEPAPLKKDLENAKVRLEKLLQSSDATPLEAQPRIKEAIKAHKDLINMLEHRLEEKNALKMA